MVTGVKASGENIKELSNIVKENSAAVRQIAAAVGQQNAGITQIFTAVADQNKMMDDTVKSLNQTDQTVALVRDVSHKLTEIMKRFRV